MLYYKKYSRLKEQLHEIVDEEPSNNNHKTSGKDAKYLIADNSLFKHSSNEDQNKFEIFIILFRMAH